MRKFVLKLQQLGTEPSALLKRSPSKVVLLTGLSSFACSDLSDSQKNFLKSVTPIEFDIVLSNFPYHEGFLKKKLPEPPILIAGFRNFAQYLSALFSRPYAKLIASFFQVVIDHCEERLIVITGSCGLALFRAARPHLIFPDKLQIKIIALGPVGKSIQDIPLKIYRGKTDWISRILGPHQNVTEISCGHMDYYSNTSLQRLIKTDLESCLK